jgi:hypothetical protein
MWIVTGTAVSTWVTIGMVSSVGGVTGTVSAAGEISGTVPSAGSAISRRISPDNGRVRVLPVNRSRTFSDCASEQKHNDGNLGDSLNPSVHFHVPVRCECRPVDDRPHVQSVKGTGNVTGRMARLN